MGMGGQSTGSSVGAILGGIAGTFLLPGVGTALGATLGGGIGSLIGGAVDSGGSSDPRGKQDQNNPAATPATPMNRTVNVPPPSYKHGVEPEFSFFNKFEEGGPVLPLPQFNQPINSAGQTSMQQYFPNYTPTGPGTNGSPSWAQIAAATAPTLAPLRTGVPSMQAEAFDPLTYGRTGQTPTPTPTPTPQPPVMQPTQPTPEQLLQQQGYAFYNNAWHSPWSVRGTEAMNGGIASAFGTGYGGDFGASPGFSPGMDAGQLGGMSSVDGSSGWGGMLGIGTGAADIGGSGVGHDIGGIGLGGGGDYARGGPVRYADGGAVAPDQQASIYQEAVLALQGRHPNPESILEQFIKIFGPAALNRLRMEIAAGIAGQVDTNPSLQGGAMPPMMSDGMSDSIPATVNGQQPARLSEGEFVVDSGTVSALGNGSTEAGIRQLEGMRQRVRQQAHGTTQQQNKVNPMAALPR